MEVCGGFWSDRVLQCECVLCLRNVHHVLIGFVVAWQWLVLLFLLYPCTRYVVCCSYVSAHTYCLTVLCPHFFSAIGVVNGQYTGIMNNYKKEFKDYAAKKINAIIGVFEKAVDTALHLAPESWKTDWKLQLRLFLEEHLNAFVRVMIQAAEQVAKQAFNAAKEAVLKGKGLEYDPNKHDVARMAMKNRLIAGVTAEAPMALRDQGRRGNQKRMRRAGYTDYYQANQGMNWDRRGG